MSKFFVSALAAVSVLALSTAVMAQAPEAAPADGAAKQEAPAKAHKGHKGKHHKAKKAAAAPAGENTNGQ